MMLYFLGWIVAVRIFRRLKKSLDKDSKVWYNLHLG
jgi:hypothetical protein